LQLDAEIVLTLYVVIIKSNESLFHCLYMTRLFCGKLTQLICAWLNS